MLDMCLRMPPDFFAILRLFLRPERPSLAAAARFLMGLMAGSGRRACRRRAPIFDGAGMAAHAGSALVDI